ncbi:ester cyclase [Halosolutus gelatinilyticus]|uniref:ester cyclase n=1 Tax=Halosolutus gelatinilyticus TaxID=2931975 RepID=UPI001FF195A8|nr:ester cyclase [Halosolutus gelatinilyticus]
MPAQSPLETVRRDVEEIWNGDDLDAIDDLVSDDFVYRNPMVEEDVRGPDEYRWLVENFRGAVPDFEMTVEEMIADGDTVATRFRTTGTHEKELLGVEPTGNEIDVTGMIFDHVEDGRITERRVNDDAFGFMRQLGLIDQQPF